MTSTKEKINQGWLRCFVVLEVLGKPSEYIDEVIKKVVETLGNEKNMEVLSKEFYEPKPVENSLFITFVEMEVLIKNLHTLLEFIFSYMPSNIEIIEPKEMKFGINDANEFVNKFAAKVHEYDERLKSIDIENIKLRNKIIEIATIKENAQKLDVYNTSESKKSDEKKTEKKD